MHHVLMQLLRQQMLSIDGRTARPLTGWRRVVSSTVVAKVRGPVSAVRDPPYSVVI